MSDDLVTSEVPLSDEVRDFLVMATTLYASGDADRIIETVFTEDAVWADHRPLLGVMANGWEQLRSYLRATLDLLPDFRVSVHVLATHGDIYLARDTYEGHTVLGGGEAMMQWWIVDELRDGRLAREDIYETEELARGEFERRVG